MDEKKEIEYLKYNYDKGTVRISKQIEEEFPLIHVIIESQRVCVTIETEEGAMNFRSFYGFPDEDWKCINNGDGKMIWS